ncbi:acyl-CoA dehydrogenase family protein [Fodinicola feengrottensis]|uniref:acyl-CoA dehydrogenase family protein n=1 Tax=Fodinicola feengrottensis TaxID=435914 RepID=UPI0024426258|nr:acyl-CoA dehydrogenase family protein [Fodinicola feengrottensis]
MSGFSSAAGWGRVPARWISTRWRGSRAREDRADDPAVRDALAEVYLRQQSLRLLNALMREQADSGHPPGARGSISKLVGAQAAAFAADVAAEIAGPSAIAWEGDDTEATELARYVNSAPASAIAGGTSQIQRNIIGERVLGLPKETQVDRNIPFNQLKIGTQGSVWTCGCR